MSEFFTHKVGNSNYSAIFGGWTADPDPQNRGVWYNYVHQENKNYASANFDGGTNADAIAFALPGYRLILYDDDMSTQKADANALSQNTIKRVEIDGHCEGGQLFTS